MPLNLKMRTNSFVPNSSNISARYTNYISLHNIHYYIGTNYRTKLSDNIFEQYFRTKLSNEDSFVCNKKCLFQYNYRRLFRIPIVFFTLKTPLFPPSIKFLPISIASPSRFLQLPRPPPYQKFLLIFIASSSRFLPPPSRFLPPFPPPHACDSSFTQFQLSSSLRFFSCDSSSPPAISLYLLPFKTITMPEIPSTFLIFYSIYPRFNLSIRFVFHPFERSFA